jgi:prevent-host-death family protein
VEYVSLRELKNQVSEVIRAVRDRRARYIVTLRGRPVAVISPLEPGVRSLVHDSMGASGGRDDSYWAEMDALRAEIDAKWQVDQSASEVVSAQRR